MDGDAGGGFFIERRPTAATRGPGDSLPPPPTGPSLPGPPPTALSLAATAPPRSPILGIVACVVSVAGLMVTMLGGNQGGLVGLPVMLLGGIMGIIAIATRLGRLWGLAATAVVPVLVVLAVLGEVVKLFTP